MHAFPTRALARRLAIAVVAAGLIGGVVAGPALADDPGVDVSGTLLSSAGAPVANAGVTMQNTGDGGDFSARTDASGHWDIDYVTSGQFRVEFDDYAAQLESWAYGKSSPDTADLVTVGSTDLVVNDTEPAQTEVSGTVTDATTKAPLSGICASYVDPSDPSTRYGEACTGADGTYTLVVSEPGHYAVEVADESGKYAGTTGPAFDITAGQQVTGQNFALRLAGGISGTVVDRATGTPVANICPSAYLGHAGAYITGQTTTCSSATGAWSIGGLPAGKAAVYLGGDQTHVGLWLTNAATQAAATLVTVKSGQVTAAGSGGLHHGAKLIGKVTNQAGQPVAGAWVQLGGYSDRCGQPCSAFAAQTAADGTYTISNIDPTTSIVNAENVGLHDAPTFSGGVTNPDQATKLTFAWDRTVRFNAVLTPEARLKVTLRNVPVAASDYVEVDAYSPGGHEAGTGTEIQGPNGVTTLGGLYTGKVKLRVIYGDSETTVWYDGAATETKARAITTTSGKTTAVTFTLG